MTDAEFKQCIMTIKGQADIRPIAIDDADSIIRCTEASVRPTRRPLAQHDPWEEREWSTREEGGRRDC